MTYEETPRIYVACLAAYNNGHLHGKWLEATGDLDDLWRGVKTMLKESPIPGAEEYAVHNYEGFRGYDLGEYAGVEHAHEIACFINEYGELGSKVLSYWCGDLEQAKQSIQETYIGQFTSVEDFAEEITADMVQIPEMLQYYIDYEAMARDMVLSGDVFTIETGFEEVHVFWNH